MVSPHSPSDVKNCQMSVFEPVRGIALPLRRTSRNQKSILSGGEPETPDQRPSALSTELLWPGSKIFLGPSTHVDQLFPQSTSTR